MRFTDILKKHQGTSLSVYTPIYHFIQVTNTQMMKHVL